MSISTMLWVLIAFGVYLVMMIAVGAMYMSKNNSSADYFLGGRNLGGFVAALSAQASDMSGWLLMGLPGSIYALGTGQVWIAVGLFLGTVANWLFISGRLRKYTIASNNSLTLPEFFTNRFRDEKKILLGISSVVIVIFFLVYTASALASGGKLFNSIFGIDYHIALAIGAIVILVYTFMGGFLAVCTTDFIQGTLMLIALLAVPLIAYALIGGGVGPQLASTGVEAASFLDIMQEGGQAITATSIISSLAWGLGYCGMPHILVRFMAIKDEKELKKSKAVGIVWVFLSLLFASFIGILGRAYLAPTILGEDGAASTESVFIEMIKQIFTVDIAAPFVAGVFLCAILAAIMSTADSQLLVTASAVAEDLYKGIFKKDATEKQVLSLSRAVTVVVAVLAFVIAWNPDSSIMGLVSDAWAGFGAAFGPIVILALFWKRTNLQGAIAGIVSGAAVVILWDYIPLISGETIGNVTGLYSLVPGFAISLLLIVVVSLVTPAPSDEIVKEFESVG